MVATTWLGTTRGRVVLGGLAIVLLLGLGLLAWRGFTGPTTSAERISYAVVTVGNDDLQGEVVAFTSQTGAVVQRIPAFYQPDIAVSPGGDRLFLLYSQPSADHSTHTNVLSVIDTRSWKALATTTIEDRFMYTISGPTTLALSPDGTRLFVMSSNALHLDPVLKPTLMLNHWLTVVDVASLQVLPTTIPVLGCGGSRMVWAAEQLVLVCGNRTARFIDPQALRVVATVDFNPLPVGVAVDTDQETVYVVTIDLGIVAINARTHAITRKVTIKRPQPEEFGSIPNKHGVARSADGRQLIVGVMAVPLVTSSAYSLYVLDLASLDLIRTVRLPSYASIAAAPNGGLYLFQSGNTDTTDWALELTNPDFSQITRLTSLDGPVHRLVP